MNTTIFYIALRAIVPALLLLPQAVRAEETTTAPPYTIGFIISLTGPLAEFGEAIRNGVTLAAEDNPQLSRVFQPVFEDSKYDSKTAALNFEKLRAIDKVQAVYVFGGPMTDTLAPIAERSMLPLFSTEYDTRYTKGKKYVVRFANNGEDYASALLTALRSKGYKKFALIKVENQYHNTLADAFIGGLKSGETAEVVQNFLPGEKDFRAAMPKLHLGGYDALGVYLSPGMQNAFFKQLQAVGKHYPLFGTDTFESRQENSNVEKSVEGALFANSSVDEAFVARYRSRFNNTSQVVHAALAYEFARLVADLFQHDSAAVAPDSFIKRFAAPGGRPGACGEYFYRNSPQTGQYFSFPIAVREVRNGEPAIISVQPAP